DENVLNGCAGKGVMELIQRAIACNLGGCLLRVVASENRSVLAADEAQTVAMIAWMIVDAGSESVYKVQGGIKCNNRRPATVKRTEQRSVVASVEQLPVRLILCTMFGRVRHGRSRLVSPWWDRSTLPVVRWWMPEATSQNSAGRARYKAQRIRPVCRPDRSRTLRPSSQDTGQPLRRPERNMP